MKFNALYFSLSLFLIFACTSNENKTNNNESNSSYYRQKIYEDSFGIHHNFTLGIEGKVLFYNISSLFCEKENTILVLDKGLNKVLRFDENGNLLKQVTSKNFNLPVFNKPTFIVAVNNFVLVTEQYSQKAHLFNKDLTYVKDIKLNLICNDIFVDNGTIMITGGALENTGRVEVAKFHFKNFEYQPYFYTSKLPELLKEKIKTLMGKYIWKFGSIVKYKKRAYFIYYYQNILTCFDDSTLLYNKEFKEFPRLSEVLSEKYLYLPKKKIFNDITIDKFGHLYILVGEYSKYPNRLILKVDEYGKEINTIVLPHEAIAIYISSKGKLFSIDKNKISIHSYSFSP